MSGRPFVFVDRDGTLVEDAGYVHRVEDYARLPGAAEGLRRLQAAGYGIAIVTNQSGIGRGRYTEGDYRRFQAHLVEDFRRAGVEIEASYFAPDLPGSGSPDRKPATGMLERARRELGADLARSWVIGDTPADVELAANAGCRCVFVLTGQGAATRDRIAPAVPVAADLAEAAELILAAPAEG